MKLVGSGTQLVHHPYYNADGVIANGGTAQLVLAQSPARSTLFFQNLSATAMYLGIGVGTATATITNGAVTGISVVNGGFGFTKPPVVRLLGGGLPYIGNGRPGSNTFNTAYLGLAQPNAAAPTNVATAVATISGGAISGFTITNPGSNYKIAPYVQLINSDLDPYGCELPSATYGIYIAPAGGFVTFNATFCPTDPVSVFCSSTGAQFTCRYSD